MSRIHVLHPVLCSFILAWGLLSTSATGQYVETVRNNLPRRNMKEYGLVDDGGRSDQTAVVQQAIDDIAAAGGGQLVIPRGTYLLNQVALRTNVHLLIEKGTVLKPAKNPRVGNTSWLFEAGLQAPVENVSIRGLGGPFTISLEDFDNTSRVRAIVLGDVTNFLIENVDILDRFTVFSSIVLVSPDTEKTGFVGPTSGIIRNCRVFNADNGYGLIQCHAAKNIVFENLYAEGGVALRLECGVRPKNPKQQGGLFNLVGKNIRCKNGYCALLLSPHSTHCGVVRVEDVEAVSCEFAVKLAPGFVSKRKRHEGPEPGTFAKGTTIRNVRAIFGTNAQLSAKHLPYLPKALRSRIVPDEKLKMLRGPAITAVLDLANYDVKLENVKAIGFDGVPPVMTSKHAQQDPEVKALRKKYTRRLWKQQPTERASQG